MLPYHVALQRAAEADKAEKSLAGTIKHLDASQTEIAKLRDELTAAVAERNKARSDAVASAKLAQEQAALATKQQQAAEASLKQAVDAARKAKRDDEDKQSLIKGLNEVQLKLEQNALEAKNIKAEKIQLAADLKKAVEEIAQVKEMLAKAEEALKASEKKSDEPKKDDKEAPKESALPSKESKLEDSKPESKEEN
jgi:hypothetical protein